MYLRELPEGEDQTVNKISPDMIRMRRYEEGDDLENVLELINSSYKLEIGDTGLAFKKFDRLQSTEDIEAERLHIAFIGAAMVGCIVIAPGPETDAAYVGGLLYNTVL